MAKLYPNYEEAFDRLYKEHHISGNQELMYRMYDKYFRSHGEGRDWVDRNLSDFGKKKKGNGRTFTFEDKMAIERALGIRWVDIEDPIPESSAKKDIRREYKPDGWRYAAYLDETWYYEKLYDSKRERSEVSSWYDEYDKSIVDYILEYRATNGFKYLVDQGGIYINDSLEISDSLTYSKSSGEYLDWLFELDDAEMFMKMIDNDSREYSRALFSPYLRNLIDIEEEVADRFFEKFINSNNIFSAVLKFEGIRQEWERELAFKPGILWMALKYALEKKEKTVAQMIINSYQEFLEKQSEILSEDIALSENNPCPSLIHGGLQFLLEVDSQPMAYFWNIELLEHDGEFSEQLKELDANTVLDRLFAKDLAKMEEGKEFIKDGVYYIKKSDCLALEALKYLSKAGCDAVPEYLGEKDGVTMLSAYKKNYYAYQKTSEAAVAEVLGKIHRYSKEKLGDGKVYSYANRLSLGYCGDGKNVISNWQSCKIGTVISDITLVLLGNFTDPLNYGEYSYLFTTYRDNTFNRLCSFLNAYPDKDAIKCFGDSLNTELESMLFEAIKENDKEQIIKLYIAKGFAESYRKELNKLTSTENENNAEA